MSRNNQTISKRKRKREEKKKKNKLQQIKQNATGM